MADTDNAAKRLARLMQDLDSHKTGRLDGWMTWAVTFGLARSEPHQEETMAEVMRLCVLARNEYMQMRNTLVGRGFDPDVITQALPRLLNNFTASGMLNTATRIPENEYLMLKTLAVSLPNEPASSTEEEIQALSGLLEDLEDQVEAISVPPYVKTFFHGLLAKMRQALRDHRIVGAKAFGDAALQVVAGMVAVPSEVREAVEQADSETRGKVYALAAGIKKTVDYFAELGGKISDLAALWTALGASATLGLSVLHIGTTTPKALPPAPSAQVESSAPSSPPSSGPHHAPGADDSVAPADSAPPKQAPPKKGRKGDAP